MRTRDARCVCVRQTKMRTRDARCVCVCVRQTKMYVSGASNVPPRSFSLWGERKKSVFIKEWACELVNASLANFLKKTLKASLIGLIKSIYFILVTLKSNFLWVNQKYSIAVKLSFNKLGVKRTDNSSLFVWF